MLTLKGEEKKEEQPRKPKLLIVDTITELGGTTVSVGSEVGDTCPMCREGEIVEAGGCNTCTNCGAQLQCGL